MSESNHRVRETCLICEGRGRQADSPPEGGACAYCAGTGVVFSRTGAPPEVLMATGDCKVPLRRIRGALVKLGPAFSQGKSSE
jgi:hypothetical protein